MITMSLEERQLFKTIVERNLTRPADIMNASGAAQSRYRDQVQRSIELMASLIDYRRPILILACNGIIAKSVENSIRVATQAKGRRYKMLHAYDRHRLQGLSHCVVIDVRSTRPDPRYEQEHRLMFEMIRSMRDVDFWTIGDF